MRGYRVIMTVLDNFSPIETVLIGASLAFLVCKLARVFLGNGGLPSVPYLVPFLGHTHHLQTRATEFLAECRSKYGGVFSLNYLGEDVVVFSGEEVGELVRLPGLEAKQSRNRFLFISDAIGEWFGALGLPEEPLEAAVVVKGNISRLLKDVLPDVLNQIDLVIHEQLGQLDSAKAVDAHSFFSEIVVSTVAILLVGHDLAKNEQLKHIMATYFNDIESMMKQGLKWKLFPIFGNIIAQKVVRNSTPSIQTRQQIKQIILPRIESRKLESGHANNVLDSLIDEGRDVDTMAHVLMVLIFAAISTTTNTCMSLLADLLAHPKFISTFKVEQKQVIKDSKIVTKEHLEEMTHLNSAIRETLRHRAHRLEQWRTTTQDHTLKNGIQIPKGALLAMDATSLHFNEQEYPSPFEYQPFRFVGSGLNATRVSSSFVGFGSGRHACPGRFFAVQEVTAIMSTLLRKCHFETEDGKLGSFVTRSIFPHDYTVILSKDKSIL